MPYVIILATSFHIDSSPTYVGDEDSDPELMASLDAVKAHGEIAASGYSIAMTNCSGCCYKTSLIPRQVLNRLEVEGYNVVGQTIDSQTGVCLWTLHKPSG